MLLADGKLGSTCLERVDKLLPKNDKERKPTELTPYVASRR